MERDLFMEALTSSKEGLELLYAMAYESQSYSAYLADVGVAIMADGYRDVGYGVLAFAERVSTLSERVGLPQEID